MIAGGAIRTLEATKAPAPQAGRFDRFPTPAVTNEKGSKRPFKTGVRET